MTSARPVAVLFIGNSGAGKSTLLSQLSDHQFGSGVCLNRGYTTEIEEHVAAINGQSVVLMDVPGAFEFDPARTEDNAKKLTAELKQPYDFKLYFVLQASNRGPTPQELVMMHEVNKCVRQSGSGEHMTFRIIVNQIPSNVVKELYKPLADNNFVHYFDQLRIDGYSFDIKIGKVLLLDFDENGVKVGSLRETLEQDIQQYDALSVRLEKDLTFDPNEVNEVGGFLTTLFSAIKSGAQVTQRGMDYMIKWSKARGL